MTYEPIPLNPIQQPIAVASASPQFYLRTAMKNDVVPIVNAEKQAKLPTWPVREFVAIFNVKQIMTELVQDGTGKIYGYMVLERRKNHYHFGKFVAFNQNLAVANLMTRKIASQIQKTYGNQRAAVIPVRESDLWMQLMLRNAGYQCFKVQRDYYQDTGESAYLMIYRRPERVEQEERNK